MKPTASPALSPPSSVHTVEAIYDAMRRNAPATVGVTTAQLTQVAPRIRVLALRTPTLPPAAHTNAYVVGPPGGPVAIIDPGTPWPDEQAIFDRALGELDVALVLLTHHHGDHVGGARAISERTGAPIAAHAITADLLAGNVPVARTIGDGETLVVGGTPIEAVFTPGHAAGHLCFTIADHTIAGDMVAGIGTILIDPDEGDMARYLASLEALLARPAGTLLPAHGDPIVDGRGKLVAYLAHRRMREQRVLDALAQLRAPATAAELTALAYADTPPALWMIAERSLLAHLGKLVAEGRVARSDDGVRYHAC